MTLDAAQEIVKRFHEVYVNMPLSGQIRLLVADGIPTVPVKLIDTVTITHTPDQGRRGIVWLVERLDTGERLRVARGTLKRQLNEMEALAWVAR